MKSKQMVSQANEELRYLESLSNYRAGVLQEIESYIKSLDTIITKDPEPKEIILVENAEQGTILQKEIEESIKAIEYTICLKKDLIVQEKEIEENMKYLLSETDQRLNSLSKNFQLNRKLEQMQLSKSFTSFKAQLAEQSKILCNNLMMNYIQNLTRIIKSASKLIEKTIKKEAGNEWKPALKRCKTHQESNDYEMLIPVLNSFSGWIKETMKHQCQSIAQKDNEISIQMKEVFLLQNKVEELSATAAMRQLELENKLRMVEHEEDVVRKLESIIFSLNQENLHIQKGGIAELERDILALESKEKLNAERLKMIGIDSLNNDCIDIFNIIDARISGL